MSTYLHLRSYQVLKLSEITIFLWLIFFQGEYATFSKHFSSIIFGLIFFSLFIFRIHLPQRESSLRALPWASRAVCGATGERDCDEIGNQIGKMWHQKGGQTQNRRMLEKEELVGRSLFWIAVRQSETALLNFSVSVQV